VEKQSFCFCFKIDVKSGF